MDDQEKKHKIVSEYFAGGTSTRKLGIKYGCGHVTISRWIMAYKKHAKHPPLSFSKKVLKMEEPGTVEELQEALRLSLIKIELLETMIDISDEQFGTDIRKKAGTRQS